MKPYLGNGLDNIASQGTRYLMNQRNRKERVYNHKLKLYTETKTAYRKSLNPSPDIYFLLADFVRVFIRDQRLLETDVYNLPLATLGNR